MNKTPYKLRHVACNMKDFKSDRHRFRYEYNEKEYTASCYEGISIIYEHEDEVPSNVRGEIREIIYHKIDTEERKWRYPQAAYDVADAYYKD